jgi:hypothetical protein
MSEEPWGRLFPRGDLRASLPGQPFQAAPQLFRQFLKISALAGYALKEGLSRLRRPQLSQLSSARSSRRKEVMLETIPTLVVLAIPD